MFTKLNENSTTTEEEKTIPELEEYLATLSVDKSKHTIRAYSSIIKRFIKYFEINSVEDIEKLTSKNIQDYLIFIATKNITENSNRDDKNRANSTANTHFTIIKVFLNWLSQEDRKYIKSNPMGKAIKKFNSGSKDKEFFTAEERDMIILACKKKLWLQVTMALLFYTGLRREEASNLKISDYHGDHITVLRKGNKFVKLYFPKFVTELIDKYLSKRKDDCEYLLVSIRKHHQISGTSINERVKEACRMAGIDENRIKDVGAHTIRRSFACILFLNGWSAFAIQDALSHSSVAITERYVKPAMALMSGRAMKEQESPKWWSEEK